MHVQIPLNEVLTITLCMWPVLPECILDSTGRMSQQR